MRLFDPTDRPAAEALASLASCNPFIPEWLDLERRALGQYWIPRQAIWSLSAASARDEVPAANPNLELLHRRAEALLAKARQRGPASAGERERQTFADLALFVLYNRYQDRLYLRHIVPAEGGAAPVDLYAELARDAAALSLDEPPEHLLALLFQFRRAFHFIFRSILGGSPGAGAVRAAVWQSIFTHDMQRYRRRLFAAMHDIATLITGPSGTGKDLAARAIGLSRYIPFSRATRRFAEDFRATFQPLNLSALSPTLIESELFGHCKGSFTGALHERTGYLDGRQPFDTVFLDEIAEVDVAIQVKLLRVLEGRTFQRLGDNRPRCFRGKIIAATNRDLAEELRAGRFRTDLYYRLNSDTIRMPALVEQLRGRREELHDLVTLIVRRVLHLEDEHGARQGDTSEEAEAVCVEVLRVVDQDLGPDYQWPGNMRELEQCVRNVLVRRSYTPARPVALSASAREALSQEVLAGRLTAEALLDRYCTLVYSQCGSYEESARRLGLDRRTVKRRVDAKLLAAFRAGTD